MLFSNGLLKQKGFIQRGSSLVEYAILLAFVAVLAVLFSPEHLPDYGEDGKSFVGKNISTSLYFIFLKIQVMFMHALNLM